MYVNKNSGTFFLLAFFSFLLLTLAVALSVTASLDNFFAGIPWPDGFAFFLPLGSHQVSFLFLCLIPLLFLQSFKNKTKSTRATLLFWALFFLILLLEVLGKTFVPTSSEALLPPLPFLEGTYPSGHMMRITFFALFLFLMTRSFFFFLLPPLQGLAMLAVAGHTVSDLFGGALLALSAYFLFLYYSKKEDLLSISFPEIQDESS